MTGLMEPLSYANIRTEAEIRYINAIREDQDNLIHHLREDKIFVICDADSDGRFDI